MHIIGIMIESNLKEGKQNIKNKPLLYGVSITDSCVNLKTTEEFLEQLHNAVKIRFKKIIKPIMNPT